MNKDHNSFIPFVIVVTGLVALWLLFFSHNSILSWIRASSRVRSQEKEMVSLRKEIQEMDVQIEALSSNKDSLEAYAREHYRFAAPGDDVFIAE